jgi:hypothetical protein
MVTRLPRPSPDRHELRFQHCESWSAALYISGDIRCRACRSLGHDHRVSSISSPAALDAWLRERDDFQDGHLARVEQSTDGTVTLRLEQYVRLGLRPGEISKVEVYELVARSPDEFETPDRQVPDYVLTGVGNQEAGGRMVILIDLWPQRLRLVTEHIAVRQVGTEYRRTRPRVADEFSAVTCADHDDRYWPSRVSDLLGAPVVWRVLGGRTPRAAGLSVDGCFLQTLPELATTDHGVFCWQSADGSRTTMSRYSDVETGLWRAVRQVAADFDRISSGNCVFDSADWVSFLDTGGFPPDHRLRGTL